MLIITCVLGYHTRTRNSKQNTSNPFSVEHFPGHLFGNKAQTTTAHKTEFHDP